MIYHEGRYYEQSMRDGLFHEVQDFATGGPVGHSPIEGRTPRRDLSTANKIRAYKILHELENITDITPIES